MGPLRRFDVSMPLFAGMPVFPGDMPFATRPVSSVQRGDPYSLSALTFGSHAGTHVDPPSHFIPGGATVDELDLELLNGPCLVVAVAPDATAIGPEEVAGVPSGTRRVLFRTANSARWARTLEFFPDYVAVTAPGAKALYDRGTRLVGVDALSVESDPTHRFPVHHFWLGAGALILEGLLLAEVPAGEYRLDCLPLKIRGGDGGPARVTLTTP